jgi:hypothetical protein
VSFFGFCVGIISFQYDVYDAGLTSRANTGGDMYLRRYNFRGLSSDSHFRRNSEMVLDIDQKVGDFSLTFSPVF